MKGGTVVSFDARALAVAEYPDKIGENLGYRYNNARLDDFLKKSIPEFLGGHEGENAVYSPLSAYMALSMLAETTDGNTRAQILELLGCGDIEKLREIAGALWETNYCTGDMGKCVLASSMWLNDETEYNQATTDALAKYYYASAYQGKMGDPAYDALLQKWINDQTGGLLSNHSSQLKMPEDIFIALVNTVWFKGTWSAKFNESFNETRTFHGPYGDAEREFMVSRGGIGYYYWGENFSAISRSFTNGRDMWFILPDKGVTPEELLQDEEAMRFIANKYNWANRQMARIYLFLPKFDVDSNTDMLPGLENLGVTDALNMYVADFSPLSDDLDLPYVSKAEQAARVIVDEEGCEAAAYTVIMGAAGSSGPPANMENIIFDIDRPFIFTITGPDGLPLFAGIVNEPNG